jgi:hypothetical protein
MPAPHCLRPPAAVRRSLLANDREFEGHLGNNFGLRLTLHRSVRDTPARAHATAR